ncbi:MAG TPA: PP2C family protein-serine/threonine phosphatase, partial [Streptosporangiaceae bacterium]|nr:PP2C family protein-serine/threonine phosphatase [Streptosporangiaceae bacterium]
DIMATVSYTVADPSTWRARIASAGHFAPVVAAPGEEPVLADIAVGVPIGVADDPPRQTTTIQLAPGAVLCQFTDGLVERRGVLIDDRLGFLCRSVSPGPPESVCVSVMGALVGSEPVGDDVAILVLRWQPASARSG